MEQSAIFRYFVELKYRGTRYHGWQVQANANSVQGEVNRALSTLLEAPTETFGAGRTDTGVHARFYVAHFDSTAAGLDADPTLLYHLNRILPADIAITRIIRVRQGANARFDAIYRGYEYLICREKSPFLNGLAWMYYGHLNVEWMQLATQQLVGYSDFTSFSKLGSNSKNNTCKIYHASWHQQNDMLIFSIKANRFLRNMVRAIVGTLVDVGRGKITPEEFASIVEARDRSLAGTSAPAEGLYLTEVKYPKEMFL